VDGLRLARINLDGVRCVFDTELAQVEAHLRGHLLRLLELRAHRRNRRLVEFHVLALVRVEHDHALALEIEQHYTVARFAVVETHAVLGDPDLIAQLAVAVMVDEGRVRERGRSGQKQGDKKCPHGMFSRCNISWTPVYISSAHTSRY